MTSKESNAWTEEEREAQLSNSRENDVLRNKIIIRQNEEEKKEENNNAVIENKKNMSVMQIQKFINKLKNTNVTNLQTSYLESLQNDIKQLNISKYLSEIFNYIFNLIYYVNKYPDLFLFINLIKYMNDNYENVGEHIDKTIFARYFKLDEDDKNYFFIVFYDLYNNISESNFSVKEPSSTPKRPVSKEETRKLDRLDVTKNGVDMAKHSTDHQKDASQGQDDEGNVRSANQSGGEPIGDDMKEKLKELRIFQKAKSTVMKNLNAQLRKEGPESDTFMLDYDLFGNEHKETKFWKSNLADQKAYIKEMFNDSNFLKKLEKKNKIRKTLICVYFELLLLGICKNNDLLTYMFINMTFFFTLTLDSQVFDNEKIALTQSLQEKRDGKFYSTTSDVLRAVRKHLAVNTIIAYNYFFSNVGTVFFMNRNNVCSIGDANVIRTSTPLNVSTSLRINGFPCMSEIKDLVMNILQVFYNSSMHNLLIYLYGEHVINEYTSSAKISRQKEEFEFFSIYDKCKKLCCFMQRNGPNLDEIQIIGIEMVGLNEESVKHIKLFDNLKKKKYMNDKEVTVDESYSLWINEEERLFYTKFPDYSNINVAVNDDECDDDDTHGIHLSSAEKMEERDNQMKKKSSDNNSCNNNNNNNNNNISNDTTCEKNIECKRENAKSALKEGEVNASSTPVVSGLDTLPGTTSVTDSSLWKDQKKGFNRYLEKLLSMNSEKILEDHVMTFLLNYNTKKKRKIVANTITHINQVVLNLIPFYCRYIAIINIYRKDMTVMVIEEVKRITEKLIKEKLPCQNKKTKCIKYICELTKFKLLDMTYILDILNLLNENFTSDHAELSFYILENCSSFLLNNSKTHIRFLNLLQKIKKMKSSRNLSTSLDLLFEECCIKIEQEFYPQNKNLKKKKKIQNILNKI